VLWLLDKVDHFLSSKRNDALHSPVVLVTGADGTTIRPYELTNNPRAEALKQKDILKHLIWYRENAESLRVFCVKIRRALRADYTGTWPERPTLPHLGPQTTAKKNTRVKPP
jgi:hypothetical protein